MNDALLIMQSHPLIVPATYIVGGLLLGLIFHLVFITHIRKLSKKTKWKFDDILVKGLGKTFILWFLLAGAYIAIPKLPIDSGSMIFGYQMILILAVASVAIFVSRTAIGFIDAYATKGQGKLQATSIFSVLTKGLIFVIAGLVILQTFGISITPILTALGVGGLAVALALQETLASLFAGLHLIASKKFRPGDFIELDGTYKGNIYDITWRNTTIKTVGGNMIIVPNTKMAGAILTNYARPKKDTSVIVNMGVSYDSDLKAVEKIALEEASKVMKRVKGGKKEAKPLVRFKEFGESSINFAVILKVKEYTDQYRMKHEFIKAIQKRFRDEGIVIPFPQREITITRET